MNRLSARPLTGALAACALAAATLTGTTSTPAEAATGGAFYRATLAAPLEQPRQEILKGVVWRCAETSCAGTKSGSRPEIVCARLARSVGPVASFAYVGDALDAEGLARCNEG